MRTEYIHCKTLAQAREAAPWAAKFIKVEGGYKAFESLDDYKTAMVQK